MTKHTESKTLNQATALATATLALPFGDRQDLGHALENKEIDAFLLPHPPHSVVSGQTPARRLFADCQAEELEYFNRVGDYPIMHVVAIRQNVVEGDPWLAQAVFDT